MKTILITGASSGIGKATAKYFQSKGWNVIATMRSPNKEKELKKLDNVFVTRLDVTEVNSIKKTIKDSIDKYGKIDVILNNAGYGLYGKFETFTPEQIQKQYDVNVFGVMNLTREILPHMRKNKEGLIINVSSLAGKLAFSEGVIYVSTKFAIEGFSEALKIQVEKYGINVKIIEPGSTQTDFGTRSLKTGTRNIEDVETKKSQMGNPNKAKIASKPEDIARVIYKSATDNRNKFRYPAGKLSRIALSLRKLLPDRLFFWLIKKLD